MARAGRARAHCQKRRWPSQLPLMARSENGSVVSADIQHDPPHDASPCAACRCASGFLRIDDHSASEPSCEPLTKLSALSCATQSMGAEWPRKTM